MKISIEIPDDLYDRFVKEAVSLGYWPKVGIIPDRKKGSPRITTLRNAIVEDAFRIFLDDPEYWLKGVE